MEGLSVHAFSIQRVADDPQAFAEYDDPHGYFADCDRSWIEMLRTNPHAKLTDLAIVFVVDGNRVVGSLGVYPGRAFVGDEEVPTASLAAFGLQESYRKSGAGGMLLLRVAASHGCLLASGGPGEDPYRLYLVTRPHCLYQFLC